MDSYKYMGFLAAVSTRIRVALFRGSLIVFSAAAMEGSARVGSRMGIEALPLPPPPRLAAVSSPSPAASIRAHLARAAGGVESCQSPRSLLSRILQRGDGGGSGGKFGCRVRLPRRYSSTSAAGGGGGGREEAKDTASEQDAPARVKVVGRAPELSLDTPRSSCTLEEGRNGKKKPEEEIMSMNIGLGASLVLLLSKGAVELNKMVELRAQMEALVSEIRKETQSKQKDSAAVAVAAASSSQESDGRSTTAVKDPIARAAVSDDAMSNCSGGGGRAAVVMHRMEAELQVELSRLQCAAAAHGQKRAAPMHGLELPLLQVKTAKSNVSDSPPRSCVVDEEDDEDDVAGGGNGGEVVEEDDDEEEEEYDEEEEEEEEYDAGGCGGGGDKSPPHGGVSARALERRLYELLQKRQQERIVELEAALDTTQRRLHEKEREVVWWRDAAKLVTHRRDESRRFARS